MTSDARALFEEASAERGPKRKKAKSKQVFKPYHQHQVMLLPPSLEELIPERHLVRVVNETIEKLNIEPLIATYKGDGTLEHGYIDLKQYFVDGTKLRADSNKHKVVWAKNTKRYKQKLQQKINELLEEIERTNTEEQVNKLNQTIQQNAPSKRTANAVKEIQTKLLPKLEKYQKQEATLAGRNSYARTDPDATVFRTKDGQLLPAYNLLVGTQRQFIINYSFHQQKASESDGFPAHLHRVHSYNTFHLEQTRKYRSDPYRKENFPYDAATDTYRCPQGRSLLFKQWRSITTGNRYQTSVKLYQCVNCRDCPVALQCKRGESDRTIQINPTLDTYRAQARANLNSEEGIALRKRRGIDVEPPFGDIKFNQGYTRCRLRGQAKVNVEIGLLSIAHNTKKITRQTDVGLARWAN